MRVQGLEPWTYGLKVRCFDICTIPARYLYDCDVLKNQVFCWFFNKVVLGWFLQHAFPAAHGLREKHSATTADATNADGMWCFANAGKGNLKKSKTIL